MLFIYNTNLPFCVVLHWDKSQISLMFHGFWFWSFGLVLESFFFCLRSGHVNQGWVLGWNFESEIVPSLEQSWSEDGWLWKPTRWMFCCRLSGSHMFSFKVWLKTSVHIIFLFYFLPIALSHNWSPLLSCYLGACYVS